MKLEDAIKIVQKNGYHLVKKIDKPVSESKEMTPEEKLEEAKKIVNANGLRFVKESKKYSGKHPVFDSKKFQDYLLKECGLNCDGNECCCETGDECCCDQEVCICPDCGGEGCEACNFQGYIENEDPVDTIPDMSM